MQAVDPRAKPVFVPPMARANAPIQAARPGRMLFHSTAAAVMLGSYAALRRLMAKMPVVEEENFGGDLQFLTILGMIITAFTMALSAICDMLPNDLVFVAAKRLFLMIALPVEIVISGVYWPLVVFAPQLILPPKQGFTPAQVAADPANSLFHIPLWIDMGIHLLPAIALIIDFFKFEGKYVPPASTRLAAILSMILCTMYGFWVEYCGFWNKRFVYPFLNIMDTNERIMAYMAGGAFAFIMFSILNALHK